MLTSDPESLLATTVKRANSAKISKAVRFEFLICAGANHHMLHVWFDQLAAAAAVSNMYDDDAILKSAERREQISEMLRYLVSFQFELLGRLLYAKYEVG